MTTNIEGKVVVITGASSGLGEAAARMLAAEGAAVVLGARRGQHPGGRLAESARCAGDDDDLAFDVGSHARSPRVRFQGSGRGRIFHPVGCPRRSPRGRAGAAHRLPPPGGIA